VRSADWASAQRKSRGGLPFWGASSVQIERRFGVRFGSFSRGPVLGFPGIFSPAIRYESGRAVWCGGHYLCWRRGVAPCMGYAGMNVHGSSSLCYEYWRFSLARVENVRVMDDRAIPELLAGDISQDVFSPDPTVRGRVAVMCRHAQFYLYPNGFAFWLAAAYSADGPMDYSG